jgi:dihydrofolate reductase
MATLVFGMNQSLDGYVDHVAFAPSPTLFRHFIEEARTQAGSVYGRNMYEVMRYWDDDHSEWGEDQRAFAAAWRSQPKSVVSRSLKSVGPDATLISGDLEGTIRRLKAGRDGEIEVAGPSLAHNLTELDLIDEYRIYLHPVVTGHGKPYFAGPRSRLRLVAHDRRDESASHGGGEHRIPDGRDHRGQPERSSQCRAPREPRRVSHRARLEAPCASRSRGCGALLEPASVVQRGLAAALPDHGRRQSRRPTVRPTSVAGLLRDARRAARGRTRFPVDRRRPCARRRHHPRAASTH